MGIKEEEVEEEEEAEMVHEKKKKKKTEERELAVRVVNGQEHATYRAGEQADEELAGIHIGLHECSKL